MLTHHKWFAEQGRRRHGNIKRNMYKCRDALTDHDEQDTLPQLNEQMSTLSKNRANVRELSDCRRVRITRHMSATWAKRIKMYIVWRYSQHLTCQVKR